MQRPQKSKPRYAFFAIIVIVAVLVVGIAVMFTDHGSRGDSQMAMSTAKSSTSSGARLPSQANNTPPSSSQNNGPSAKTPDTPAPTPGDAPKTPYGDFVGNHKPSLGNSNWGQNVEDSVCNTSPSATCDITFTKNGVTKSLGGKQADSSGAVYWYGWTLQNVGLTSGDWAITATATLNNKISTASDPLKLQVQP